MDFRRAGGDRLGIAAALVGGSTAIANAAPVSRHGTDLGRDLRLTFEGGGSVTPTGVAKLSDLVGMIDAV